MIKDADRRKLYFVWYSMLRRCNNPNHKSYQYYGGKGVSVCSDWNVFETFYQWSINNGFGSDLTLDRIDSSKNYEPSNCRWVDWYVQESNRCVSRYIEIDGIKKNITEWARITGLSVSLIRYRIAHGFSEKDAVMTPVEKHWIPIIHETDSENVKRNKESYIKFIRHFNESIFSITGIAKEIGVHRSCLNDWKSGRSIPSQRNMKLITDYLGVDVNYFL